MVDQHPHSQLSQETDQYSSESSGDLVLIRGLGFSTQPPCLLVPDAGITGNTWNRRPFLSTTQPYEYGFCLSTVDLINTIVNVYNPVLGGYPNHDLTLPLDETSVANEYSDQRPLMAVCSLPGTFPRLQTRPRVDNHFAVEVNSPPLTDHMESLSFLRSDTETPQPHTLMANEPQAIRDVVANAIDRKHSDPEIQIPIMPVGPKPFPDDCSFSPPSLECSTRGSTRVRVMPQEEDQASRTHNEGEHRVASIPAPPSQLHTLQHRGTSVGKMAKKMYQCISCGISFSQRQGLSRHNKDKHEPKKRCDFCEEFTWPRGRRYVYRRHLQEVHPDAVPPSISVTLTARAKEASS